ncbi:MAG TPA: hypothetical protein VK206_22580 [Anaerolineales bacterium]|nr:hypothetical protein [Anaerolineales bacterium]
MDWTNIVSVIGIVGTWVTIVLVYFTLREMRNQRIASQKPDLIIPESTIYAYGYGYEGRTYPLVARDWSNDKDLKDERHNWERSSLIKLYNVGFGVAKNIELKWTGEYNATLRQIKDYCYQHSIPIIIQPHNDGVFVESDVFASLSPEIYKYDFLMPASIASVGLATSVPDAFVELVSILVHLKAHYGRQHLNEQSGLEINIPSMVLELHYDDLENSHYTKKFEVLFSLSGFSIHADEKSIIGLKQLFQASFEFKLYHKPSPDLEYKRMQKAKKLKNK